MRIGRRRSRWAAVLAASALFAGWAALPAAATPSYPVVYSLLAVAATGSWAPDSPPAGANNWSCRPSATHPRPVVLVHGTFANEDENWATLSPLLADNGYCVYTFNYGGPPFLGSVYGINDIPTSAGQLSAFVNRVLGATHASRVDVVGHSQGGMMPRYYLKLLGGSAKVRNLVGLAPSNHGTTLDGLTTLEGLTPGAPRSSGGSLGTWCAACTQQEAGSPFLTKLNAGGDTVPGVTYTVIETKYDEVVTPYTSAFLSGPGVTNITLQSQCALDFDGHVGLAFDHIALRDVLNALDPAHAQAPVCGFVPFDLGG
jgi:triacylglycerol esterase/lipase EstA (alpha/beta hydrolase family)